MQSYKGQTWRYGRGGSFAADTEDDFLECYGR